MAVKIIRAQQDDGGAMLASLNDEISMLKKVRHRCIVSYFGAVQPDEDTLWYGVLSLWYGVLKLFYVGF